MVFFLFYTSCKRRPYFDTAFIFHRAVKGSHILIGADGAVCLSGLRKSIMLTVQEGDGKSQMAHHFPSGHAVAVLPWMAPEILQQVSTRTIDLTLQAPASIHKFSSLVSIHCLEY